MGSVHLNSHCKAVAKTQTEGWRDTIVCLMGLPLGISVPATCHLFPPPKLRLSSVACLLMKQMKGWVGRLCLGSTSNFLSTAFKTMASLIWKKKLSGHTTKKESLLSQLRNYIEWRIFSLLLTFPTTLFTIRAKVKGAGKRLVDEGLLRYKNGTMPSSGSQPF